MVNISAFCAPLICLSSHAMPFITRSRSQDGMKPKSPSSTSTVPSRCTGHGDARKLPLPPLVQPGEVTEEVRRFCAPSPFYRDPGKSTIPSSRLDRSDVHVKRNLSTLDEEVLGWGA